MSKTRNYSEQTKAIMQRCFQAVDTLIADGVLKSNYQYCNTHGIDRRHFAAQKKDPEKGYFEVSWLVPLVSLYGISSDWLLTGRGQMSKRHAILSLVYSTPQTASSRL